MDKIKAAVIGAGVGGLASAIRLAKMGADVTVYEKNHRAGGKISELTANGYRFDTGPSLFTLPGLVEELFELCGEDMREHIPYKRLDVNCKYFFPSGDGFTFYHDRDRLSEEMDRIGIKDPGSLPRRLDASREIYELSAPVFLFTDFHNLSNFNTPPYKKIARHLFKLDFLRTMHGANRRDFKDARLVQIFDRYATYNGSDPYRAPATLNMIAHLENNLGAFFPERGMYSIVEGLYQLAVRQGVRFRFGTKIERLTPDGKSIREIRTAAGIHAYDLVISDVDVGYLSRELLPEHPRKKRLARSEPSSSALIFYWQVNGQFPRLELHNILFASDYKKEFDRVFRQGTLSDDNTVYIFISSKAVSDDAPAGCENWFVMINAPADKGQPWESLIREARGNIVEKINRTLGTDIEKYITGEQVASPRTIERNTSSRGGALYGASSNSALSAFLRHPNHLKSYENLYFTGGSVHPGGGIPLCLASAKIVCEEIANRWGK